VTDEPGKSGSRVREVQAAVEECRAQDARVVSEAEDAVQETWFRFSRSDRSSIENLSGWLTTVCSRICLNMLEARRRRPEPAGRDVPEIEADPEPSSDPEQEAVLADSIGYALLVILDTLSPAERVALVLHDMFGVPFEEIGSIIGRKPVATRQLASRARRRVRSRNEPWNADPARHSALVHAFLAAARNGDLDQLVAVLAPDVVLRADETAVKLGAAPETRGAPEVAAFASRARGAVAALVDGVPAAVWMPGGIPRVVFSITTSLDKITQIDLIADPDRLGQIDLQVEQQVLRNGT
jgi:RNA polymerase sigma factor (sigma-70 family)